MEQHPVARTPEEWATVLAARGQRPFRALEVFRWIHRRGVLDPARMTSLPAALRGDLFGDAPTVGAVEYEHRSADDTRKLLFRMRDGSPIETVLIPRVSGPGAAGGSPLEADPDADEDEDDGDAVDEARATEDATGARVRVTQCVSTQVGCAMGCVFCASGVAGLTRQLGPEEIVGQVLHARAALGPGEHLRNVVYMGMGEPLHNYAATKRSLELLTHREGIAISPRYITVSTSGLVPEILRLGEDFGGHVGLAISLHAADDATRGALMPINKKYPLETLVSALHRYPLPKRRRITIEYTLVLGKNDDPAEAHKLVRLLRGLPVKVNLIPMNPIETSSLGPPEPRRVLAFQRVLYEAGIACFVRRQRGDDVSAACGQLAMIGKKPKVRTHRA